MRQVGKTAERAASMGDGAADVPVTHGVVGAGEASVGGVMADSSSVDRAAAGAAVAGRVAGDEGLGGHGSIADGAVGDTSRGAIADGGTADEASAGGRVSEAAGGAKPSRRWSRADRDAFLDHFAISGDVARAATAVGKTARAAYALRRRSATFGAQWRAALDDAYERMEAALVRQVLGDTDTTMDVTAALLLLDRRPAAAIDGPTAPRKVADRNSPRAKAERELLRRVQAMAKRSRGTGDACGARCARHDGDARAHDRQSSPARRVRRGDGGDLWRHAAGAAGAGRGGDRRCRGRAVVARVDRAATRRRGAGTDARGGGGRSPRERRRRCVRDRRGGRGT